jgi:hypothetical protein
VTAGLTVFRPIVPQARLREILPLMLRAQTKLTDVVRADGRDHHDVRVVYSLNSLYFSLARAGSFPADVPLTFSNKNGLPVTKCNKEKFTSEKIFRDGKRTKAMLSGFNPSQTGPARH